MTYKLIAREPTAEMIQAARKWFDQGFDWPAALFRAMWDAAPQVDVDYHNKKLRQQLEQEWCEVNSMKRAIPAASPQPEQHPLAEFSHSPTCDLIKPQVMLIDGEQVVVPRNCDCKSGEQVAQPALQERNAIADIAAERERQKAVEGWTPEHDDEHDDRSLAQAAMCYVDHYIGRQWVYAEGDTRTYQEEEASLDWPDSWCVTWFKPKTPRRDLVRAAALIAAEIDRIDRAATQAQPEGGKA